MNKYLLGGAVAAAMVGIAPAIAQTAMPAPAPVAPQVQVHVVESGWQGRTSVHTRAEVAAHVRTMFDRLDSNRDGSITKAEADAAKANRGERMAKRIERQHGAGGQPADRGAMFDRLDTNRDGNISRDEFARAPTREERRIVIRTDNNGDGRPDGAGMMRGKHMGGMGGMGGRMFELADTNRDGRVTLQEATNAALRHFDTADVNRDGQLTPDERMQMHQRMRAERKPG
jgi:hypothetical protein